MFVLIWATLLFSVRGSSADSGTSVWENPYCDKEYCITLDERQLTAEAGLCVVILCSFKPAADFKTQHIVWYKQEAPVPTSSNPFIIFHTNKNTEVQSGFEGRVSLLEPDVSQNNCSIIINDLKQSDSGLYQLRVTADLNGQQDGFTFIPTVNVTVKGLNQKPTVTIPTLTERQQATLTCTAPGLCSGSVPKITWTWSGAGGTEYHIKRNTTSFRTENVSAFTQRHFSVLTFKALAKYHKSNITCKISFTGQTATEGSSTLNINYVKKVKITGAKRVEEGKTLNVTCSVESFPPSLVMWTKLGSDTNLHSDTGSASLFIQNVTPEHSGLYICTAKHQETTLASNISVNVTYKRKPQIIGNTTVKKGDVLNLTCSFPSALIMWKKPNPDTNLQNETYTDLHNDTGSATLVIYSVTAEHTGQYICTAKHLDTSVTSYVNVIVTWFSKIHDGSGCVLQSEALTCVCISEGFPLPTIKWPLLKNHTEYSVLTTVSNHTVNSTVSLTVKNHGNTTVECVSDNGNGEAKENLPIKRNFAEKKGPSTVFRLEYLKIIIAFLTGILLTTSICCLDKKCCRKKEKSSRNVDETLEMKTCPEDNLVCYGQPLQDNQTLNSNSEPKEVQYANIDISLLNRNSAQGARRIQESTTTEYAQIKKAVKEEQENDDGEEGEMLESEEEKAVVELKMKHCEPQKEEGGVEAVYATVNDIIS